MCFSKRLAFAIALALVSPAIFAGVCRSNSPTQNVQFTGPIPESGLSAAPRDPIGTVYYVVERYAAAIDWTCDGSTLYGISMNPKFGSVTGAVHEFPINKTGLSFRIWIDSLARYESNQFILPGKKFVISATRLQLEIFKSSELAPNITVSGGLLATLKSDNLDLMRFNIPPIYFKARTCQAPSLAVAMGDDYQLHQFNDTGSVNRMVRFNIELNNCEAGIQKITYSLRANTPIVDEAKGVVELSGSSTAKGIGLQLLSGAGQPISLNTDYILQDFTPSGTNFKIPLQASYYRLPVSKIKAGSANAEISFVVNYL